MKTLNCIECDTQYDPGEVQYFCRCGGLLEFRYEGIEADPALFDSRKASLHPLDRSGVWRFRELLPDFSPGSHVTQLEGGTRLYQKPLLNQKLGVEKVYLKHEGENPTGSFKDRGMTVAVSAAVNLKSTSIACASTGNTSASLASYAASCGLRSIVFLPSGKVSMSKISQALAYGAEVCAVKGDFDEALELVQKICMDYGVYLVNSLNPFRLEGQKSIMWETLQDLGWKVPDWIIVPGGNLGNTSAFGKAFMEAKKFGWIDRLPRLLVVQAEGANPFKLSFENGLTNLKSVKAETMATAIRIGNPVNFPKAKRVIQALNGKVIDVSEDQIKSAKRTLDRSGVGAEPASACSIAGLQKMVKCGEIKSSDLVVCVLTGNILKDSHANEMVHKTGATWHEVVDEREVVKKLELSKVK